MGACPPWFSEAEAEEEYVVVFHANGGEVESSAWQKRTLGALPLLPREPKREGYRFMGWNTARDGSGRAFMEATQLEATQLEEDLAVYAQWEKLRLSIEIFPIPRSAVLTPMEAGPYSERSTTFRLLVRGLAKASDAALSIGPVEGLKFWAPSSFIGGVKTFNVTVAYDGARAFPKGVARIALSLKNVPEHYGYGGGTHTTYVSIVDGQSPKRPIPIYADNMEAFNAYANTAPGRKRHYRPTDGIELLPPSSGSRQWTAIAKHHVGQHHVVKHPVGTEVWGGGGHPSTERKTKKKCFPRNSR